MMKRNLKLLVILLGFAIPYVLVYRAFFIGGPLAWGDAPYFYPENLRELFNLPFLWNFKDSNFGTPQYYILWLYIPTFLYGVLNHILGLGNDFLARLIFYFPATVLAIFGSWKLIGRFNQNIEGKFLGSLLYGFNTYFLMLLDGGQVGVGLAYGLFPLAVFSILSYLRRLSIKNFILALISLFVLVNADIRVALIAVFFVGVIGVIGGIRVTRGSLERMLKGTFILGLSVLGLSGYWIVPTISSGLGGFLGVGELGEGMNLISLSNALFLFQPHFPLNQFGTVLPVPFYFAFVPLLISGALLFKNDKPQRKIITGLSLLFLLLVFLAKGGSDPLGGIYLWLVENIPLGVSFRDSSKFYIPLLLTAGLLLSFTISSLSSSLKNKWHILITIFIYGYLIWLVNPALTGNLTGTLGKVSGGFDYQVLYQKIKEDDGFGRTLWFKERPPLSYASWSKPALSGDQLIKERPFASMNAGKYDYFNFLHSPQAGSWLKLLGVKYVFLPGDERKKIWPEEDITGKAELSGLVGSLPGLHRMDLALTFPAYQIDGAKPHIFAQRQALFIVGGEDIYDRLDMQKDYLSGQGFVFLEEGRTSPEVLEGINPDAASLVFWGKDLRDLQMTFLQDKMLSVKNAVYSQWQSRSSGDYLTWKYDLLKQGIDSKEFDFGKGIAFSTVAGEKIKFDLNIPERGNYYLAARYTNATQSAGLKLSFSGQEEDLSNDHPEKFRWQIMGPFTVGKGEISLDITNLGGFVMLNTLALTTEKDFLEAGLKAGDLTAKFGEINIDGELEENFLPVNSTQISPTEYKIDGIPSGAHWLVFLDHYNLGWILKSNESLNLPFYAMVNGFYLPEKTTTQTLYFSPQTDVIKGIWVSGASIGLIVAGLICVGFKKRK